MRVIGGTILTAAGLVAAVSAVVFGATVVDAFRVEALPPGPAASQSPAEDMAGPEALPPEVARAAEAVASSGEAGGESRLPGTVYPRVTGTEILAAVNNDVFRADRTPTLERYLLPGERPDPTPQRQNDRRQRGPELRVVGAALMGDRALALIQVGDTLPIVLMVGESVEGYRLASVDAEGATLVMDEEILTLPVTEPLRSGGSSDSRDSRRGTSQADRNEQAIDALQQRVQQMLRGVQGGGRGATGAMPGATANWQMVPGQGAVMRLPDGSIQIIRGGQLPGGGQVTVRPRGGGGGGSLP